MACVSDVFAYQDTAINEKPKNPIKKKRRKRKLIFFPPISRRESYFLVSRFEKRKIFYFLKLREENDKF